jgi:hypothetical protein
MHELVDQLVIALAVVTLLTQANVKRILQECLQSIQSNKITSTHIKQKPDLVVCAHINGDG